MKAVNRRNFLNGTAGAMGAVLLSTDHAAEGSNQALSLEQAAEFLHELVVRHADRNAQFFGDEEYSRIPDSSFMYSMERLRFGSVDEIQHLLKPLSEGGAS